MLKVKCPKHPKYAGKQSPRCSCISCQTLYNMRLQAAMTHLTIVEPVKEVADDPHQDS